MTPAIVLISGGILIVAAGVVVLSAAHQACREARRVELHLKSMNGPRHKTKRTSMMAALRWPGPVVRLFVRAGFDFEHTRVMGWGLAGCCVTVLIVSLLSWVIGILSLIVMMVGFGLFLERRANIRITRFLEEFPDMLDQMRLALTAGLEPSSAFIRAVESRDQLIRDMMRSALTRIRLGGTLAEGMDTAYDRLGVGELQTLAALFAVHERFGGSLNQIMSNMVTTLRNRERMRREFGAFSSEVRTSAKVLAGLPLIVALLLVVIQPDHLRYFLSNSGQSLGIIAICIYVIGLIALRRVVRLAY